MYDIQPEEKTGGIILPGFDDEEEEEPIVNKPVIQTPTYVAPEIPRQEQQVYAPSNYARPEPEYRMPNSNTKEMQNTREYYDINLDSLLTRDKKVVAFVGTSKNGTSFLVKKVLEQQY